MLITSVIFKLIHLQGHKFDYKEDWGEAFTGFANPSIFLLEVEKESIISVELEDKKLSTGQVHFICLYSVLWN